MTVNDLYGVCCDDLEEARITIEEVLGISFAAHESRYRCGDYYRYQGFAEEQMILQNNYDEIWGEWAEPDHRCMPILIYVDGTSRAAAIQDTLLALNHVSLLRHREH